MHEYNEGCHKVGEPETAGNLLASVFDYGNHTGSPRLPAGRNQGWKFRQGARQRCASFLGFDSVSDFFVTGWYLFLVYPITSLLNSLRPPYETLGRITPGPFARTLAIRILLTAPICLLALIAINLEAWNLSRFQAAASSNLFIYHSLEEIGPKVLRTAVILPVTAVFSWMISRIWSPKMFWTELSSLILFVLFLFFHDMILSIGLRNGGFWQIGIVETGYAGLLFFGTVKAYE